MQVQPVTRYRRVRYPVREQLSHQDLTSLPHRWRNKKAIALALTATSLASALARQREISITVGWVTPSKVLTESVAYRIFTTESKKHNVHYVRKGHHIKLALSSSDGKTNKTVNYAIDGYDPKHRVGYDFVTEADRIKILGKKDLTSLPEFTKQIREGISKTEHAGRVKVIEAEGTIQGYPTKKDLRKEAREFMKWLKSQGVI